MYRYIGIAVLVTMSIVQFCTYPHSPSDAMIAGQTIENIPDEIPLASVYPCSVSVLFPEFIDSFSVVVTVDMRAPEVVAGNSVGDDTLYLFDLMFPEPGEYSIALYLYQDSSIIDSFVTARTVRSLISNETVSAIPDSLPFKLFLPCTVSVHNPDCIDSVIVVRSDSNGEYSRTTVSGTTSEEDIGFDISFPDTGFQVVGVLLFCGAYIDTLVDTLYVFSTIPIAAAAESVQRSFLDDGCSVEFTVSDPDSNLLKYRLTAAGEGSEEVQFLAGERHEATVSKSLPLSYLVSLTDTINLISLVVMDEDSQSSSVAVCTLMITDTLPPELTSTNTSLFDTVQTIVSLPDTIPLSVNDNWQVDSVKFDGQLLTIGDSGDAAVQLVQLDSGRTGHEIEVWDRADTRTARSVELYYSGPKVYPPVIASIIQTINEGEHFDTVYLDDFVTITNPDPAYTKDSLEWSIAIDNADSGMTVHFDSVDRTLFIQAPSGEIYRNRMVTLSVTVTDPLDVSRTRNGVTFMMVEQDDPPRITINGQIRKFGTPFDTLKLDTCGYDPEGKGVLSWTIEKGNYFYPDSVEVKHCLSIGINPICRWLFTGRVAIVPDTAKTNHVVLGATISDTLLFTLKNTTAEVTTSKSMKVPFTWRGLQIIPAEKNKAELNP